MINCLTLLDYIYLVKASKSMIVSKMTSSIWNQNFETFLKT